MPGAPLCAAAAEENQDQHRGDGQADDDAENDADGDDGAGPSGSAWAEAVGDVDAGVRWGGFCGDGALARCGGCEQSRWARSDARRVGDGDE